MAVEVRLDHVSNVAGAMQFGRWTRVVRIAHVKGLSTSSCYVLQDAVTASGMPDFGDRLVIEDFGHVVLTEKNPTMIDRSTCEVELVYEPPLNEGQDLDGSGDGDFAPGYGETETVVSQKESNVDYLDNLIELTHTYPADDPVYPSQTHTHGVKINYYEPEKSYRISGLMANANPWTLSRIMTGSVNSKYWNGGSAREWMCTACRYKFHDQRSGSSPRWMFTFEFQYNPDTWDADAIFSESGDNNIPANLVAGVGYKKVQKQSQVDFAYYLRGWIR